MSRITGQDVREAFRTSLPIMVTFVVLGIVYCLKDVSVMEGSHAIPEIISMAVVSLTYLMEKKFNIQCSCGHSAVYGARADGILKICFSV